MQPNAKHLEVAASFHRLLTDAGLASPDRVDYASESVIFLWDRERLAVIVDLEDVDREAT